MLKLLTIEPIAFVYSPILHTTWRSCQLFFNREGLFGTQGELLLMALHGYNYDVRLPISVPFTWPEVQNSKLGGLVHHPCTYLHAIPVACLQVHHKMIMKVCFGADFALYSFHAFWLAEHFGNLVAANEWVCDRLPLVFERVLAEPNQAGEGPTLSLIWMMGGFFAGQHQSLHCIFTKAGVSWRTAENFIDNIARSSAFLRKRGDTCATATCVAISLGTTGITTFL